MVEDARESSTTVEMHEIHQMLIEEVQFGWLGHLEKLSEDVSNTLNQLRTRFVYDDQITSGLLPNLSSRI